MPLLRKTSLISVLKKSRYVRFKDLGKARKIFLEPCQTEKQKVQEPLTFYCNYTVCLYKTNLTTIKILYLHNKPVFIFIDSQTSLDCSNKLRILQRMTTIHLNNLDLIY